MENGEWILLLAGALVLFSVLVSKASEKFGVPALLLFLALGMLAGAEGPGGIYFDDANVAQFVGIVALVLILYFGGLDTSWPGIRRVVARGAALSTVGILVTTLAIGFFVYFVTDFSLLQGLLLGAVVSSTDAAAVFAILRSRDVHLPPDVRRLLEFESGANDPMAVFLTVTLITIISEGSPGTPRLIGAFVLEMGLGAVIGLVMSKATVFIINRIQLHHDGLYPVLSLALVVLTYGASAVLHANGFLAVYIAGIVMGNSVYIHKRSLIRFHDGLAWIMQIGMFLTLGLLVFPSHIVPVIGIGLLIAAFLTLVARPLSVFICLAFSRFDWRARALVSWVGLRGAAPVILATFPLVAGVQGANRTFNLVFFVVVVSVLLQGTTIPFVARRLHVQGPAFHVPPVESDELPSSTLVEYAVRNDTPIVGRQIAKMDLPDTAKALLIRRYGGYLVPTGGTRLRRDDVMVVLADDSAIATLNARSDLERIEGPPEVCRLPEIGA